MLREKLCRRGSSLLPNQPRAAPFRVAGMSTLQSSLPGQRASQIKRRAATAHPASPVTGKNRTAWIASLPKFSEVVAQSVRSICEWAYSKRRYMECCDLSQLCSILASQSGDKSPHSIDVALPFTYTEVKTNLHCATS